MARGEYKGYTLSKCPYYIREGLNYIVCEGYEGGSRAVKSFKTEANKERHQLHYCFDINGYCDCSQCILLEVKQKLIYKGLREGDDESDT